MTESNDIVIHGESELGSIVKKVIPSSYLQSSLPSSERVTTKKVKAVRKSSEEVVYDVSVANNQNLFVDGVLVHNCFEISFIPVTEDGVCGVQFCNLTTQNGLKIKTLEEFLECVEAATIIGTLQAAYTDFPYLSKAAEFLTKEESLLGVSLTGWLDNPQVLLNEKNQYLAAKLADKVNSDWAKKIGVNKAARITCVKPEGTSVFFFGDESGVPSSGAHPHHAKEYFKRVQVNKMEKPYQYFKAHNAHMSEESIWSSTNTDDVLTFYLTAPDNAIVKDDLSAIDHLNIIRKIQENWVVNGTTDVNKKPITHNVSCTVLVDDHEWDDVVDYIYENRQYFAAIALLSKMGDKSYPQAPLERLVTTEDLKKRDKIMDQFIPVDWAQFNEEEDETNFGEIAACAGGACEVPQFARAG